MNSTSDPDPLGAPLGSMDRYRGEEHDVARIHQVNRRPVHRFFALSELVASTCAVCVCLHVKVKNVMCARCFVADYGIFCFPLADQLLG